MEKISAAILPIMIVLIIIYALIKKTDIFPTFIEGAAEGIKTSFAILPALIALMTAIGIFKVSGALDILTFALKPITNAVNMPSEVVPLVILRPISGSGALAVIEDILRTCGPDSFAGRVASVMEGSTETTFYTIAVYYGAVGINKTRYTLPCALMGDLTGYIMSIITVSILFR